MNKKLNSIMYWQGVSMSTINVAFRNLKTATNKAAYQTNKLRRAIHQAKVRARK